MTRLVSLWRSVRQIWRYCIARACGLSKSTAPQIQFIVGFQGMSGGSEAVALIANMLAREYCVYVNAGPTSSLNLWLLPQVRRGQADFRHIVAIVCDRQADLGQYEGEISASLPVVCTVHGFLKSLHGLSKMESEKNIRSATLVHFVSSFQARDFDFYNLNSFVIPNATEDLHTEGREQALLGEVIVGMVGFFHRPGKNLQLMVRALSHVPNLPGVVWGSSPSEQKLPVSVRDMGYSSNRKKIFGSFDIFFSLSVEETFGMVVIQAMSAGRVCVLSDIEAHRQFAECPGVYLVPLNDLNAIAAALRRASAVASDPGLRAAIRGFYRERYSVKVVQERWIDAMASIINARLPRD